VPDELPPWRFKITKVPEEPERKRAAIRRALDLVASFLTTGGDTGEDPSLEELERMWNEDPVLAMKKTPSTFCAESKRRSR